MRWSDFFNIDKILAATVKTFFGVLAFILFVQLILIVLSQASSSELVGAAMGLGLASIIAYFIRERRMQKVRRPPNTRGAERTPLLPTIEDDQ